MKIFNVIDTEKVARGMEELSRKVGLSMSSEDSREILTYGVLYGLSSARYYPATYHEYSADELIERAHQQLSGFQR